MKSISTIKPSWLLILLSLIISNTSLAQHFVIMTIEQSIEPALDMTKNGV
jgi:hypothetical protein